MTSITKLTAAQAILVAAADLAAAGTEVFTEWDLTVRTWLSDKNRFGLRGYEQNYPDHKRIMTEVMGQTKKDNPIRRGWMMKAGTNRYRVTNLGLGEASRLRSLAKGEQASVASPQQIYEPLERLVFHSVFLEHRRDDQEPRSWTSASAFLGLTRYSALVLDDTLRHIRAAIAQGVRWFRETGSESLNWGPTGGKRTIRLADIEALDAFIQVLERRFAPQLEAIRRKK